MPSVIGIDLSSKAIDLVKLDESSNRAEWRRIELTGADAWARTLSIRGPMTLAPGEPSWWDDVYLVAIEAPYGTRQAGTQAILNRVVGAIAASLPAALRKPECCWVVRPDEWKAGLGLKGKPTQIQVWQLAGLPDVHTVAAWITNEHARDAYCLALWARDENAKAIAATLEKDTAA